MYALFVLQVKYCLAFAVQRRTKAVSHLPSRDQRIRPSTNRHCTKALDQAPIDQGIRPRHCNKALDQAPRHWTKHQGILDQAPRTKHQGIAPRHWTKHQGILDQGIGQRTSLFQGALDQGPRQLRTKAIWKSPRKIGKFLMDVQMICAS